jgi:hypothetical protein
MDEYVTKPCEYCKRQQGGMLTQPVRRGDLLASLAKVLSPIPKPDAVPETTPVFAR